MRLMKTNWEEQIGKKGAIGKIQSRRNSTLSNIQSTFYKSKLQPLPLPSLRFVCSNSSPDDDSRNFERVMSMATSTWEIFIFGKPSLSAPPRAESGPYRVCVKIAPLKHTIIYLTSLQIWVGLPLWNFHADVLYGFGRRDSRVPFFFLHKAHHLNINLML